MPKISWENSEKTLGFYFLPHPVVVNISLILSLREKRW